MRLTTPRVPPVSDAAASDEQKAILAPMAARGPVLNVFRTVAQDPEAAKAFLAWGGYILSKKNGLAAREREIVILRTGYLCKSGYEWTQHVRIGLDSGLTEAEVEAIKGGPSHPTWNKLDSLLIQASDELFHDKFISDATWGGLAGHLSQKQLMDLVFTVGQYTQVSMFLNSFGVQLDPGQTLDPELKGF